MATRIRFGGYQGDNSVHTRGARVFCDALRRIAGDTVEVEFRRTSLKPDKRRRIFCR